MKKLLTTALLISLLIGCNSKSTRTQSDYMVEVVHSEIEDGYILKHFNDSTEQWQVVEQFSDFESLDLWVEQQYSKTNDERMMKLKFAIQDFNKF